MAGPIGVLSGERGSVTARVQLGEKHPECVRCNELKVAVLALLMSVLTCLRVMMGDLTGLMGETDRRVEGETGLHT